MSYISSKQYNIKPLLYALGILFLSVLIYGFVVFLRSGSDTSVSDRPADTKPVSPEQAAWEEETERALDALEAMKAGERKVPTVMDRARATDEQRAALDALDAMNNSGRSAPMPERQEADREQTARQQQAALDALDAMNSR